MSNNQRLGMAQNVRMYNPTHRYDTTGESGPTDKPTVQWSHEFDMSLCEVAVWDGQVYVAASRLGLDEPRGSISVIDTDGDPQWCFQTDGSVPSPVVKDGRVYVAGGDTVYALGNSDTGSGKTGVFKTCSACQAVLNDYDDSAFCPACGADLPGSGGNIKIYDSD